MSRSLLESSESLLERTAALEAELVRAREALVAALAEKEALEGSVRQLRAESAFKDRKILRLERELEDLRKQVYGRSSEKEDPVAGAEQPPQDTVGGAEGQGPADSSPEGGQAQPAREPEPDERRADPCGSGRRRRRRGHGRKALPAHLPRRRVEIHPPPEELICPCCGKPRRRMKGAEEVSERVDYVPASVVVVETVRFKYSCETCEEGGVAIGRPAPSLIERGRPTEGMLAYVTTSKYGDSLPLSRLVGILARHGVELNRSTLSGWVRCAAFELRPIVKEMARQLLEGDLIRFDETGHPVLDREVPAGIFNGRVWAYRNGPGEVVFVYSRTKAHEDPRGPKKILKTYRGFLQADAAPIFDVLFEDGTRVEVGCNAHARRRFVKAKKTEPEAAKWVIGVYQQLYRIERKATSRGYSPELRLVLRQLLSAPLIEALYEKLETWRKEEPFLPQSAMGQAVSYAINHREALCRFLEDGRLPIDNNDTERALRAVVIGRKNCLFAGSERGAEDAAVLYSLVQSCKELGLDPFVYLKDVLQKLAKRFPASRIAELTPKGWKRVREALETSRAPP